MSIFYYKTHIENRIHNFRRRADHGAEQLRLRTLLEAIAADQPTHIVFVCTGNICRSAYAHYALLKEIDKRQLPLVEVSSSGVATTPGKSADSIAKKIAKERDVDLSTHLTSFIYRDGLDKAAVIVVMEPLHRRHILAIAPTLGDKIIDAGLLGSPEDQAIIPDPFGHNSDNFRTCFDILDRVIQTLANALESRITANAPPMTPSSNSKQ